MAVAVRSIILSLLLAFSIVFPLQAAQTNARSQGREAEFEAELDAFCREWNRGTDEDARFDMAFLVAVGTRD